MRVNAALLQKEKEREMENEGSVSPSKKRKLERQHQIRGDSLNFWCIRKRRKKNKKQNKNSPLLNVVGFDPVFGRGMDAFHQILGPPCKFIEKIFKPILRNDTAQ